MNGERVRKRVVVRGESMVDFCKGGPRAADVKDVDASDEEPEGLSGFDVR